MTVADAKAFIKRGIYDGKLRGRLNDAQCVKERNDILSDESMQFSQFEFEEAYRNMLTSCTEKEAADQLREFKIWWELLIHLPEPGGSSN